jgi:hypothetical protein
MEIDPGKQLNREQEIQAGNYQGDPPNALCPFPRTQSNEERTHKWKEGQHRQHMGVSPEHDFNP